MKQQQGFTLVELVIVIVVLGILAAVAVPKFVDLSGEAEQSAVDATAASLSSATAMNFAAKKLGKTATPLATANVCTHDSGLSGLLTGGAELVASTTATSDMTNKKFKISGTGNCLATADPINESVSCTLTSKGNKTATATIVCAR